MSPPQYHQLLRSLTEDEYHERSNLHDAQNRQHLPLLYVAISNSCETVFEDNITLVIRDALIEISDDDVTGKLYAKDRDDFDAAALPFNLKLSVLGTAKQN